jgi:hypothetical protein
LSAFFAVGRYNAHEVMVVNPKVEAAIEMQRTATSPAHEVVSQVCEQRSDARAQYQNDRSHLTGLRLRGILEEEAASDDYDATDFHEISAPSATIMPVPQPLTQPEPNLFEQHPQPCLLKQQRQQLGQRLHRPVQAGSQQQPPAPQVSRQVTALNCQVLTNLAAQQQEMVKSLKELGGTVKSLQKERIVDQAYQQAACDASFQRFELEKEQFGQKVREQQAEHDAACQGLELEKEQFERQVQEQRAGHDAACQRLELEKEQFEQKVQEQQAENNAACQGLELKEKQFEQEKSDREKLENNQVE